MPRRMNGFAMKPPSPPRPPASARTPYAKPKPDAKPWAAKPFAEGDKPSRNAGLSKAEREARFAPKPRTAKDSAPEDCDVLYGIHSVREALANPARRFHRLLVTENALVRLSEGLELRITPDIVKPEVISKRLTPDAVHQGAYLEAEKLPLLPLKALGKRALVLALDQVTDPHNVGAILRSAAAFGVDGVLTTFRNSPEVTGVLAKAASGALEHVPIIGVTNLARALTELGEQGFQIIGLDSEAEHSMGDVTMRRPLVLVLGAEGKGLRPSTRALCTTLARLDMPGAIKSLNVSNAAAISLYAVMEGFRKHEG